LPKPYTPKHYSREPLIRVNDYIRAPELRVIGPEGENIGLITKAEALAKAREYGLDLIEISPNATPPVAKIMDFGRYQYDENKKLKAQKARTKDVETKSIQIKVGTSDNDVALKAKKVSLWLADGHRIKLDLFLSGRFKYMDEKFLRERLDRILFVISTPYRIADPIKKGPKGLTVTIEKAK
jgi:translation initiation factor IF-3